MNLIVAAHLPFRFTELPELKILLEETSGRKIAVPNTKHVMTGLDEKFNRIKTKLIRILNEQKYVCTTCNVWSSRGRSFIGITVHFIDHYKRKSYVLAFRELVGRQTYKALSKIIANVFAEYLIPLSKITHVVTDGGCAFCKAFRVYGNRTEESLMEDRNTNENIDENEEPQLQTTFMYDQREYYYSNLINFDTTDVENDDFFYDDDIEIANESNDEDEIHDENETT